MEKERRTFRAVVTGNCLQKSEKKKTPSVAIAVATQYDVITPQAPLRLNLVGNLWLSYACTERTIKTLRNVFGWKGQMITELNDPILVGKECNVVCEEEEWDGNTRWSIVFFNRCSSLRGMEAEELAALVEEVQPSVDEYLRKKNQGNKLEDQEDTSFMPPLEDELPY